MFFALVAVGQEAVAPQVVEPGGNGKAPSDAIILFDGKDTSAWTKEDGSPTGCVVKDAELLCTSGAGDLFSRQKFISAQIHLEFAPPLMPESNGQLKGNSGVYIHHLYEIQILDSYNNPTYATGIAGALYGQAPPLVNAARPPEHWQSFDIVFHAPQCGTDGKLVAQGTVTVLWNGVLVQDHTPILESAKSCTEGRRGAPGPLVLQDHSGFKNAPHTIMKFRNIWIRKLKEEANEK